MTTVKATIPIGYSNEYILGWYEDSEKLYEEFCQHGKQEIANKLLHSVDTARRVKWAETVENLDFQISIRQVRSLFRKLGASYPSKIETSTQVAFNIASISRTPHIQLKLRIPQESKILLCIRNRTFKQEMFTTNSRGQNSQPF